MKRMTCDAVSPVVGVMLMLVVTIIIAAVVSAFAGGLGGSQQKTPQVSITATPVVQAFADGKGRYDDYPTGFTAKNGIEFENKGGDTFSLKDINVQLTAGGTNYVITPSDKLPSKTCLPANITIPNGFTSDPTTYVSTPTNWSYFGKIGGSSIVDSTISPGDKFMFYADGQYDSSNDDTYGLTTSNGKYLTWTPEDVKGGIGAQFGTKVGYTIIDRVSGKAIASGYVIFQ